MFHILVHRGLSKYPESGRLALQKSLEKGFGIEIDVHRTKDGILVVTHDKNLKRLYGQDLLVPDLNLKQVKDISRKKNHEILTLTETLELFKQYSKIDVLAAIQVKDHTQKNIAELTVKTLEDFDMDNADFSIYERVFIFDATKDAAKQLKNMQPKLKVGLSVGEEKLFSSRDYRKKCPTIYTLDELWAFGHFDIVWADEWQNGLYTEDFVKKAHKMGKLIYAVSPELHKATDPSHPDGKDLETIKNVWRQLISWGVDGICTDYPEELAEVLKNEKD